MLYDLILLGIILNKILIIQSILRIPKLIEFCQNLLRYLSLFCRYDFCIPLFVACECRTCNIGTANNNSIYFSFFENVSLCMKTFIGSINIVHFYLYIFKLM